jgi:hypothetical protein
MKFRSKLLPDMREQYVSRRGKPAATGEKKAHNPYKKWVPDPDRKPTVPAPEDREREILALPGIPKSAFVLGWDMSDAEIEMALLGNAKNRALIEARGRVNSEDYSDGQLIQRLGWHLTKMGWNVVPQSREGVRAPAPLVRIGRGDKELKFPFKPSLYRERHMTVREFLHLERTTYVNIALQCCAASAHIRVIDIDCRDEDVANKMRELAEKHLGVTPFIRVGAAPKMALIYRVEERPDAEKEEDRLRDIKAGKWTLRLLKADGSPDLDDEGKPRNAVEYLSNGTLLTAFGYHHKTGKNFEWIGSSDPTRLGPEAAPVITTSQLREFTRAVADYRPVQESRSVSNPGGAGATATEFDSYQRIPGKSGKVWMPKRLMSDRWKLDSEGRVTEGAEEWLTAQTWTALSANAWGLYDGSISWGDLYGLLEMECRYRLLSVPRDNAAFATEESTFRTMRAKVTTAWTKWKRSLDSYSSGGGYLEYCTPMTIGEDGRRPIRQHVPAAPRPEDGSLDWMPTDSTPIAALSEFKSSARTAFVQKSAEQIEADKVARSLIESREERKSESNRVRQETRAHINDWLYNTVSPWLASSDREPSAPHVLRGPTGVGKTVGTLAELAEWCRENPRHAKEGPVLLVLPTHANAGEAMAVAQEIGMFAGQTYSDEMLDAVEGELAGYGVKITRFRGRIAAGCQRADEMQMLTAAGIGGSNLCGSRVEVVSEEEDAPLATTLDIKHAKREGKKLPKREILCPFRKAGTCGYYKQMSELLTADIVIVPHAYLTIRSLPKQLRAPRAVIIDESVTYALLQQTRMPLSVLRAGRAEPYVTADDRKTWPDMKPEDISLHYVQSREDLCEMVLDWIEKGSDIPTELLKLKDGLGKKLLAATKTLCSRNYDRSRKIRPDLSREALADIAAAPTGRFLLAEIRMWDLIEDRMDLIEKGKAKGEHDMRWQVVEDWETDPSGARALTPHMRLSWRVEPNWAGTPTLLLDASAKQQIIGKLFGMQPVMKEVRARMRVRTVPMIDKTWSNSSFIPPVDASEDEIKTAAENLQKARRLITTMAMIFGHGRVLVGTTAKVRDLITAGAWTPPPNVDFVHFGALRGRDFAKGHAAAISIGRSEQPISIVDGYAAALTYDDDVPEEPFDKLGTGFTAESRILYRPQGWQRLEMRTGHDVDTLIAKMPGKQVKDSEGNSVTVPSWGQLLEESWREEELAQFVGRLRPVHRSIDDDLPPPVYICVGKVLPPGVIVDEIADLDGVLRLWPMAELARVTGGIIADGLGAVPGAREILKGRSLKEFSADLPKGKIMKERLMAPFEHVRYRLATDDELVSRSAMILPGWTDGDHVAHFEALSERYGQLVDVISSKPPKIEAPVSQIKPKDSRDIDRDDALIAELELREAHAGEVKAAEHSAVMFELARARGLYDPDPEAENSALSDAPAGDEVAACVSTSKAEERDVAPPFEGRVPSALVRPGAADFSKPL